MNYTIPKPRPSAALLLLAALVSVGLVALFLAALAAFSQIMHPLQAVFAAALIEASLVVEAIAFVRGRNWIALGGMLTSLTVSGIYNFIQAETAGAGLNSIMLFALALGPLSSLAFLAMATGKELARYEAQVSAWQDARQVWQDKQSEREARRKERDVARQAEAQARQVAGKLPDEPERKPSDWRALSVAQKIALESMTNDEIMQAHGVSERTVRNWRALARANGYHEEVTQ